MCSASPYVRAYPHVTAAFVASFRTVNCGSVYHLQQGLRAKGKASRAKCFIPNVRDLRKSQDPCSDLAAGSGCKLHSAAQKPMDPDKKQPLCLG